MFIIGASLGSIIRKGGFGIPVLISIILFVLYHVLNMVGEKAVKESALLPYEGMWMANLVFSAISLRLLYIANKDDLSGFTISHYASNVYSESVKDIRDLETSESILYKLFIKKMKFIKKIISHNLYLLELSLIWIPFFAGYIIFGELRYGIYLSLYFVGLRIIFSTYYFFFKFNNKRFNKLTFFLTTFFLGAVVSVIYNYWKKQKYIN